MQMEAFDYLLVVSLVKRHIVQLLFKRQQRFDDWIIHLRVKLSSF